MKKILLLFALTLPLWAAAQSVTFHNTWMEFDVTSGGEQGMYFHFDFSVYNCWGKDLYASVFISDSKGNWMSSRNDAYKSKQGSVYGTKKITTLSDSDSHWNDLKIFIPYSAMSVPQSGLTYKYTMVVRYTDGKDIKQSDFYVFDWASHGYSARYSTPKPTAIFEKAWVEFDVYSDGEKGMYFHYDFSVYNHRGKEIKASTFIIDSDSKWMPSNNPTYESAQGSVCSTKRITTLTDTDSHWSDLKIFIPYSAMSSPERGKTYKHTMILRQSDNTDIKQSDFYVFDWAGHAPNKKSNYYNYDDCDKPGIEWLSKYESSSSSFTVKAGIMSDSEITDTEIAVNGSYYRGMSTVKNDGYQMMLNQTVTLREGVNEIVISATNYCGTTTRKSMVIYTKSNDDQVYGQKRVALVIGNAKYKSSPLVNPANDANDVASALRNLGFDVRTVINGSLREMEDAVTDLSNRADRNAIALFYYAGHGIQKDGVNYLVPIDADPQVAADVPYVCYDVNRLLANMEESGSSMNIVVLDACRNDPFGRSWSRGSSDRGFATLDISGATGTFISYATSPGKEALDGDGRHSPYAEAFIKALNTPGLELQYFFRTIQADVKKKTGGAQVPWNNTSVTGDFYFNPK
ncbi:MAG: caspase family protein [Bacteroidales bacterium]|nr:caspase family protein [Bacteroidales bacterium]